MRCESAREALHAYIDNELAPMEELDLEAHLLECQACAAEYSSLRAVVDTVRGATPLYEPSAELQRKLSSIVEGANRGAWRPGKLMLHAAATAVALMLWLISSPPTRSGTFNAFAAEAHLRHASGRLPLDIASGEPRIVSGWLGPRIPFRLDVPDYPNGLAYEQYMLEGARLMQYAGGDVAFVAWRMRELPVSLLVSSSPSVQPSGDRAMRSGKLIFHFSDTRGLKVVTWRDHGLTYALVSAVEARDTESCVVCHGADRFRFEPVSPRVE